MEEGKTDKEDKRTTTLRMSVTEDEHAAVYDYARKKLRMTVETLMRQALNEFLVHWERKSLDEMAAAVKSRGKVVQGELF